jgi:hypothetical protein
MTGSKPNGYGRFQNRSHYTCPYMAIQKEDRSENPCTKVPNTIVRRIIMETGIFTPRSGVAALNVRNAQILSYP